MIRAGADNKKIREEYASVAYSASVRGAWVAALFCVLVLGLIAGNRTTLGQVDPQQSKQLITLKIRLADDPKNDKIKGDIRALDASLRHEYLRRIEFGNQGGYVLLVGVVMLLIASASAIHSKGKLPTPGPEENTSDTFRRSASVARQSVAMFGAVAALSLAGLAVFSQGNLTSEYAKATRGYHRVVTEPKESAGSAQQAATGPSAPAPQPGPAPAASSAPATPGAPTTPPNIGPLPVPGLPAAAKSGDTGKTVSASNSTPSGGSTTPRPEPVKINTVAFDESDYKPSVDDWAANWPVFRGPLGTGYVNSGDYPIKWDAASGDGILWKTEIALPGWNSPVIWGDRLFVSGADKDKREVYCLDVSSGKILWKQPVAMQAKQVDVMEDTGYAASTLAADGKRVFAIFPNGDLACFDFDGKPLWTKSLGMPENTYGHASSLTMYGSLLMVLFDQGSGGDEAKSLLMALQGGTGNCVWYAQRTVPNSWATPIIINTGTRLELVTSASPWVISYDPITGREYWRANLMSGDVAPSPIFAGGMVLACNSGACLAAIKPGGEGDVTATQVAWKSSDGLPDISSPAATSDLIFMTDSMGTATCVDLKTGAKVWDHAFNTPFKASPTIAGSRVYLLDETGVMHIIAAGRTFNEENKCALSEKAGATPAFAAGRIYIRGEKHIYCVGKK